MQTGYIYSATNKVNHKVYIGQTIKALRIRKAQHKFHGTEGDSYFHSAIQKNGIEVFQWNTLCTVTAETKLLVKEHLDTAEQMFIQQFQSMDRTKGYNLTRGGGGVVGFKPTQESLQRMRDAHIGVKNPNYPKNRKTRPPMSEDTRAKMSQSKRGAKHHMFGKHHSEEARKKISKAGQGRYHTEEAKKKIGDAHRGKRLSEETKRKISESEMGKKESMETRKKKSESMKRMWAIKGVMTPEERVIRRREDGRRCYQKR